MRNIRLDIAYDGTHYAGWQIQPDAPTIQGTIEAAINRLTGEDVRLHGSGRTDAGVHALGQVGNFHTDSTIPPERWRPALNGVLPRDIVINSSSEVDVEFHARFSAKRKTYRYVIENSAREAIPILRSHLWRIPCENSAESSTGRGRLNVEAMSYAANCLMGTHDFCSFESKSNAEESSVRTIFRCFVSRARRWELWEESESPAGELVIVELTADGFLYNMVRAIVGTLVEIGLGARPTEELRRVLKAQDRSLAGPTAPAEGLYLVSVDYGGAPAS